MRVKNNNNITIQRVGIDIRDSKNPSGVGRYIRELVNGLQSDENIELYLFHDERKETLRYKISDNVQFEYLTTKHAWFWEQFWLPIVLARLRIKVYHATNNKGLPWFYFGRRVLTIHDIIPLIYPEVISGKLQKFRFIYTLRIDAKIANIIIADSVSSKNDIIKGLRVVPNKIKVIWPVLFKHYERRKINIDKEIDVKAFVSINDKYIIHNGGLDPRKNNPRLFEAYKAFANTRGFDKVKLVITGRTNTPFAKNMVAFVESIGLSEKVVFTGEISDKQLNVLVSEAKICIYPSLYEGFGLPIIEAMAAGTPVITSNVSSMPEVAGEAAVLIDPTIIGDITKALIAICSDRKKQKTMIESGYKWIEKNKNYNMVELTKQTYDAKLT